MADELLGTPLSGLEVDIIKYLGKDGAVRLELGFGSVDGYWEVVVPDEVVRQTSPSMALSSLLNSATDAYTFDDASQELLEEVDLIVGNLTGGPLNSRISILIDTSNGFPVFLLRIKDDKGIMTGNLSTSLRAALNDAMPLLDALDEPAGLSPLAEKKKMFFRDFFDRDDIKGYAIDQQIQFFLQAIETDYKFDFRLWLITNGYLLIPEIDRKLRDDLVRQNYENAKAYAKIIGELQGRFYGLISSEAAALIIMACIMRYEYASHMQNNGDGVEREDGYEALVLQAIDLSGGIISSRVPVEVIDALNAPG